MAPRRRSREGLDDLRAGSTDDVLSLIHDHDDLVVPLANGEPVSVIGPIEAEAKRFQGVRIHQMHALHDHAYLHGTLRPHLVHVSYFLSPVTRPAFWKRGCELVPNNFSDVPHLLRTSTRHSLVLAAAAPMDADGCFSLGTNCDYVGSLIGEVSFFLEVNHRMPRTYGANQVHVSDVAGWVEVDRPLVEVLPEVPGCVERAIGAYVAERIPDGATIQVGIGSIADAILGALDSHRDLGVHTELLSDGMVPLIEQGVITGSRKRFGRGRHVATFALGSQRLYDFLHEHPDVSMRPVDEVNDPRRIAQEPRFVSVNATTEVDLVGQCASETVAGRYWSSSGGQADFAQGAVLSQGGAAFVALPSTAHGGMLSRIRATLTPGSMVTTSKYCVDHVVTEFGVAELRGRSISDRAAALIAIAHPRFRESLIAEVCELGYL
jgi:acyl-CoA hydrolase